MVLLWMPNMATSLPPLFPRKQSGAPRKTRVREMTATAIGTVRCGMQVLEDPLLIDMSRSGFVVCNPARLLDRRVVSSVAYYVVSQYRLGSNDI